MNIGQFTIIKNDIMLQMFVNFCILIYTPIIQLYEHVRSFDCKRFNSLKYNITYIFYNFFFQK